MEIWKTLMKPAFPTSPQGPPRRVETEAKDKGKDEKEAVFDRIQKVTRYRASIINQGGIFN